MTTEYEKWRADKLAHGYEELASKIAGLTPSQLTAVELAAGVDLSQSGVFPHPCEAGCGRTVQYDDEPYCFTHSPDEGSSVRGYSARRKAEAKR